MYLGLSEDECDIAGGLLGDAQGIRCDTDASGLKDRHETRNDQRCPAEVMAGVQVPSRKRGLWGPLDRQKPTKDRPRESSTPAAASDGNSRRGVRRNSLWPSMSSSWAMPALTVGTETPKARAVAVKLPVSSVARK